MSDLTSKEQDHVRTALQYLRARCGGWLNLAKGLGVDLAAPSEMARGRTVTARTAIRVARMAGVGVDDLLAGGYPPPGTCPHCGHRKEDTDAQLALAF